MVCLLLGLRICSADQASLIPNRHGRAWIQHANIARDAIEAGASGPVIPVDD